MRKLRPREVCWLAQGRAVNLWPGQGKIPAECSFHNTKFHQFGWFIFWLSVCTAWTGIVPSINGPESAPAEEMKGGLAWIKRSGFSFQLGCMTLGKSFCLFFFFLSHFHNYKNESWPRSEDKFYLWPSPKDWRSCLQHCVGRIWRGIQLSRKEGHDLLPLAQVQEHGWRRVRYCLTWTRCFLFFFFLIFIYFWLHWVLVATCRTFPCSVWALWLWLVGSRVPGLSSRPA